jgi:hypothetical protein
MERTSNGQLLLCVYIGSKAFSYTKKEEGILGIPDKIKRRKITQEEIEILHEFYMSDEHSRIIPGMNDYISIQVKEGEKKTEMQKRFGSKSANFTISIRNFAY